jgi:hypothetical protein
MLVMPREVVSLKRVVQRLAEGNHLSPDLLQSLDDWNKGLENKAFAPNAKTREEAVLRVRTMMGHLDGADSAAKAWALEGRKGIDPESEIGLRARLSDEIALCMKQGGASLPDGTVRQDVANLVEEAILQLKPDLRQELDKEKGLRPPMLEGGY